MVKKSKKKTNFFAWFFTRHDPLQHFLSFVGLIVVIYGAWFNNLNWVAAGFIPILIGYWWEYLNKK